MARQTVRKYFSKKKVEVKSVTKDDEAHSSICREIGVNEGEMIGMWMDKLKEADKDEDKTGNGSSTVSVIRSVMPPGLGKEQETLVSNIDEVVTDNCSRKERIRQFAGTSPHEFKDMVVNIHLYLPKSIQKLARTFRVLQTIQRFNAARNLSTIFIKSLRCIESLVNQRIGVSEIERMYFLAPSLFKFTRINVFEDGEEVGTFTIQILGDVTEFDSRLFEHVRRCHSDFLEENGFTCSGDRFHPGFRFEDMSVPRKPLFPESETHTETFKTTETEAESIKKPAEIGEVAKKKMSTILERIREKERLRREEFIAKTVEEDNSVLIRRLQSLFKAEGRKAIPVRRVVELLKIFDGANTVQKLTRLESSPFYTKIMGGTEYLVLKI